MRVSTEYRQIIKNNTVAAVLAIIVGLIIITVTIRT
jgi:hypothetical protein